MKINGEHGVILNELSWIKQAQKSHQKILVEINKRLLKGDKEISRANTWIKGYRYVFGIIFTVLCYIIFYKG